MNFKASIYSNPSVAPGLYYCKLLDVHLQSSSPQFIWAKFITGPSYKENSGIQVTSIIYLSEKSQEIVEKFRRTFQITGASEVDSYLDAVGRWGCVSIVPAEYQCQKYSAVVYVTQNANMRNTSQLLKDREQIIGGIEWPDHVVDVGRTR